jgi:hypothetical protein
VSVAADRSADVIYVADATNLSRGAPYVVERAANLAPVFSSTVDETNISLVAPSTGGVTVINGGAAARWFDAGGAAGATSGYGAVVGVSGAMLSSDRVLLADAGTVRALEPDGTAAWERSLPATTETIVQVAADNAGGGWVVGTFAGTFPPWLTTPAPAPGQSSGESHGHFILHFDGAGTTTAGRAWNGLDDGGVRLGEAVVAVRGDGSAVLVVQGQTQESGSYGAPAFGIGQPVGAKPFAAGFDGTGQLVWSRVLDAFVDLQPDASGVLLAIGSKDGMLVAERWDDGGNAAASASVPIDGGASGNLTWAAAPAAGGIVVAGERLGAGPSGCPQSHFLVRVASTDLATTVLDLGLK